MCSSTLHRAITQGGLREMGEGAAPPDGAVRLGNWAATLAGGNLVVAIDEPTCLTLVFQWLPIPGFRDRFAAALQQALVECGVSLNAIESECRALHQAPFVKRRHSSLNEALGFAEIEADAHAESGQPEDSIQNMLNTYSYGECAASCPKEAVAQLFGLPART